MNRSMSKIRHIQEANLKLENRLLKEDDVANVNSIPANKGVVPMEKNTTYYAYTTKEEHLYQINVGEASMGSGDADVYDPRGQKIGDGVLISVGPDNGIPKGFWGFANRPDLRTKYGDFKNIRKASELMNR